MNETLTRDDLIKYNSKIKYWKNLSKLLRENKHLFSDIDLESFVILDKDILDNSITDNEICLKAKEVYEFFHSDNEKLLDYSKQINFFKINFPNKFDYDLIPPQDIINQLKKRLFEKSENDDSWKYNNDNIIKNIQKDSKDKGWFVYE